MTDSRSSGPQPARRSSLLRWALFVSLALNLVVAGVLVGGMLRGPRTPPAGPGVDTAAIWFSLPQESRANLRRALPPPDQRAQPADRRAQAQQAHAQLLSYLRAEPFDIQAVADWLEGEQARRAARSRQLTEGLVAEIARLSADQRREMADRLERRVSARRGGAER